MGGRGYQNRIYHNHVLTEEEILRFLQSVPEGATSIQIEDKLHGTHGYQLLHDLEAAGKIHQVGESPAGTRKSVPSWALVKPSPNTIPKAP